MVDFFDPVGCQVERIPILVRTVEIMDHRGSVEGSVDTDLVLEEVLELFVGHQRKVRDETEKGRLLDAQGFFFGVFDAKFEHVPVDEGFAALEFDGDVRMGRIKDRVDNLFRGFHSHVLVDGRHRRHGRMAVLALMVAPEGYDDDVQRGSVAHVRKSSGIVAGETLFIFGFLAGDF